MECNQRIIYRYNSYVTRKILYTRIPIKIKVVKLSKQPLSIVCRGKEMN